MFQTPHHNPPFRKLRMPARPQDPVVKIAASEKSTTPSPKRKREGSNYTQPSLEISTALHGLQSLPDERCESPRIAVAKGLEALELRGVESGSEGEVPSADAVPRKRLKPSLYASNGSSRESTAESLSNGTPARGRDGTEAEIAETPDCRVATNGTSPTLAPPRPTDRSMEVTGLDDLVDQRLMTHSPLPRHPASLPSSQRTSNQSTDSQESLDQLALTWQDSEITGHDIDQTSPDDDGEGLNGIGFKPTAAMAYARSQRRKQQVNEWRAREAREARQKRAQKRQGGSSDGDDVEVEGERRAVRFAEAR
ncbi:hypothetical protein B0A48_12727 [Cryoendolithus antarcticus]|uniref:Uncharacterized protein n=1 Tax=Cryoendolithus antarcticus TaxID=1507870 RepID=A0A1V8SRI9_9PEZI|nr:hypothetical protein B0A48_12727 [Cryoendolithus antarcticus]